MTHSEFWSKIFRLGRSTVGFIVAYFIYLVCFSYSVYWLPVWWELIHDSQLALAPLHKYYTADFTIAFAFWSSVFIISTGFVIVATKDFLNRLRELPKLLTTKIRLNKTEVEMDLAKKYRHITWSKLTNEQKEEISRVFGSKNAEQIASTKVGRYPLLDSIDYNVFYKKRITYGIREEYLNSVIVGLFPDIFK